MKTGVSLRYFASYCRLFSTISKEQFTFPEEGYYFQADIKTGFPKIS